MRRRSHHPGAHESGRARAARTNPPRPLDRVRRPRPVRPEPHARRQAHRRPPRVRCGHGVPEIHPRGHGPRATGPDRARGRHGDHRCRSSRGRRPRPAPYPGASPRRGRPPTHPPVRAPRSRLWSRGRACARSCRGPGGSRRRRYARDRRAPPTFRAPTPRVLQWLGNGRDRAARHGTSRTRCGSRVPGARPPPRPPRHFRTPSSAAGSTPVESPSADR